MKVLLPCLLLSIAIASGAQENLLDNQLRAYEVKFKNLMATRGLSYNEGMVNQEKIENVVREYSRQASGTPNNTLALLFYHFEHDTLFHWLFNSEKLEATARLPLTVDSLIALENTIKFSLNMDAMLATRAGYTQAPRKYRLRTYESVPMISQILFPEAIQKKLIGKKQLVILPILNLSSFPYALLKPWGENKGTLIDSISYSFAHNFTQFFQSVERNAMSYDQNYRRTTQELQFVLQEPLMCGNPAFRDPCTKNLPALPGAELEAIQVGDLLNIKPWIGASADRDMVLDKMQRSNFIYLATHGWADPTNPLDSSYIALSGGGACGFITPRQIQNLSLTQKPIVILSACQTGLGMVHEAGIVGLSRSFLKAGAQSVLMSLWNIHDAETQKLMTLYAEELKKPYYFFPAEHWRQAVLRYKKQHDSDPLNWSAFQNFGVPYRLRAPVSLSTN